MNAQIRKLFAALTLALAFLSIGCVSSDDMTGDEKSEKQAIEAGGTPLPPNP